MIRCSVHLKFSLCSLTWIVVGTTGISALVTAAIFVVVEEETRLERLKIRLTPRSEIGTLTYSSNLFRV